MQALGRLASMGRAGARKALRWRKGAFLALALLFAAASIPALLSGLPARAATTGEAPQHVAVVLEVKGAIGPAMSEYLHRGLETAAKRDAALVILRMDTPGGLATSMREIIQDILASPVPVVTYVSPSGARAASAGTYILYASQLAAMAPGTNLGAATPVSLGGGSQPLPGGGPDEAEKPGQDEAAPANAETAKAVNDAVAYIRGLAALRGRNADWAEQAVRKAASLPATEALKQGVIEIVAPDLHSLLSQADGRRVEVAGKPVTLETKGLAVETVSPDWRTRLLGVITDPNIAYILLLVGLGGLVFEAAAPGAIFPGTIGAIALLTGLFALNLLPVSYAGVGLLLLGIGLLVTEAFVPSFGVLGIGGAAAFVLGSIFLFDTDAPGFTLSLPVIATATVVVAVLLAVVLAAVVRAHRRRVVSGEPAMIGASGEVLTWSGRHGQVHIYGERWRARSATSLAAGDPVRVTGRNGLTLTVESDTK